MHTYRITVIVETLANPDDEEAIKETRNSAISPDYIRAIATMSAALATFEEDPKHGPGWA